MNKTEEIIKIIFASAALIYFILQLAFIPLWRKNVSKSTGSLILKTSSPKKAKIILVLILCPVLIFFSLITKANCFICCLMSVVSAMACFINVREIVYGKLNGIYAEGLIGGGRFVPFGNIETFPDTSWKEPELQNTTSLAIQLRPKKNEKPAVFFIDYESIPEYSKVVTTIKDLKQNR